MRRPTWKKAQAHKVALDIAQDIAAAFSVPAPSIACPEYRTGVDWQWSTERLRVWTLAGGAEMVVDVSATFAHLYFRFDDPARAESVFGMSHHDQRLNRFSGKWNNHAAPDGWNHNGKPDPQTSIEMFRNDLQNDFERVAQPNPPADEVAAWEAAQAIEAAHWAAYRETLK